MRELALSAFHSGAYARPLPVDLTWPALVARLVDVRPPPPWLPWACSADCCRIRWQRPGDCPRCGAPLLPNKRALPAWSPWRYRTRARSQGGATAAACLVLDFDHPRVSMDACRALWAPWAHMGHTTWSHAEDAPRWRVVLPLQVPVVAARWSRLWAWACARDPDHDASCSDAGRLYFSAWRPSSSSPATAWCHDGPWLNVDELELPNVAPRTRTAPGGGREPRPSGGRPRLDAPGDREAHGLAVGGRVRGDGDQRRIVDAPCPRCGRPSVWWWVSPASWRGAGCDHRQSCGWTGWPDQVGGADVRAA